MSNNELFNWGNRTPEQEALQRRLEELALYEQAVNVRTRQTGGVGGGVRKIPFIEETNYIIDEFNNIFADEFGNNIVWI